MSLKVEMLDVKEEPGNVDDELFEVLSMDEFNTNNVKTEEGDRSNEDPLSLGEEQSGCDSVDKASVSLMLPNPSPVDVHYRKITCKQKGKISKANYLNNSASSNEHKCEKCGKCFTFRCNLTRHLILHSGEKKFKCEECGKCFTWRGNLQTHQIIHSGEKTHKCQVCGKCFSRRDNLAVHFLSHSGKGKHKCDKCEKCFYRRTALIKHLVSHSDEKKHKCNDCGECFSKLRSFKKHVLIHSGEQKCNCKKCNKCLLVVDVLQITS